MKRPSLRLSNSRLFLLGGILTAATLGVILFFQPAPTTPEPILEVEAPIAPTTPAVPAVPTVTAPALAGNDQLVLELFNPSDQSITHQLNRTNLSQQIEQALTISFILTKCGYMTQDEYRDSFRALIVYAQQTHLAEGLPAAEKLVRHISESAGVSYSLIYSRLSCDSPNLPALAGQLRSWTATIMTPSL